LIYQGVRSTLEKERKHYQIKNKQYHDQALWYASMTLVVSMVLVDSKINTGKKRKEALSIPNNKEAKFQAFFRPSIF
jgi:hypothetical protein